MDGQKGTCVSMRTCVCVIDFIFAFQQQNFFFVKRNLHFFFVAVSMKEFYSVHA